MASLPTANHLMYGYVHTTVEISLGGLLIASKGHTVAHAYTLSNMCISPKMCQYQVTCS